MPAGFGEVFGEGLLPGLQTVNFSLYLHMVERGRASSPASSYKCTNPVDEGSTLMTSLLPKGPTSNIITLELEFQPMKFGGIQSVHCNGPAILFL